MYACQKYCYNIKPAIPQYLSLKHLTWVLVHRGSSFHHKADRKIIIWGMSSRSCSLLLCTEKGGFRAEVEKTPDDDDAYIHGGS